MNLTKNQIILSVSIAVTLLGVTTVGVVHAHNVKAEKARVAQEIEDKKEAEEKAKEAKAALLKEAQAALLVAQKSPSTEKLKLAEEAVSHVKEAEQNGALTKELQGIKNRVKLETEAQKAVTAYQKDATSTEKLKLAQTAVSKLTSDYSKGLKSKLNKAIATSKAEADKAKKAMEAQKAKEKTPEVEETVSAQEPQATPPTPSAQAQAEVQGDVYEQPAQNAPSYNASAPSAPSTGGNATTPQAPSTGGGNTAPPSTGGNNGNNGGGTPTPPATVHHWECIVSASNGEALSLGLFTSEAEADAAGRAYQASHPGAGNYTVMQID